MLEPAHAKGPVSEEHKHSCRARDRTMSFLVRLIRVLYLAMYFHLSTATSIDFCMRLETTCTPCTHMDRALRDRARQPGSSARVDRHGTTKSLRLGGAAQLAADLIGYGVGAGDGVLSIPCRRTAS